MNYIVWMADHGFPLIRSIIKCLALDIIKSCTSNIDTLVNVEKGLKDNWWAGLKGHHPELTSSTSDSLDRARVHGATAEPLETFFNSWKILLICTAFVTNFIFYGTVVKEGLVISPNPRRTFCVRR